MIAIIRAKRGIGGGKKIEEIISSARRATAMDKALIDFRFTKKASTRNNTPNAVDRMGMGMIGNS
jgi:hypothetical protein